ncbi:non-canonical purine NTP pyrophosphatase [Synechococcus sp. CC9311]|uniref:non-canonical purine NTP pyrophosphatase n=1 Tax=Synechococcus sp. (strain CC9311) TaxID=64471 RepID=UPI0000DDB097|nr:non-canonical purine NTP pyrophosphatase [Synechococcus sp. CC9311]ABI46407.1 Ham1 family protein [Synechococcus sp. CC9311]
MGFNRSSSVLTLTIASGNPRKVAEIEAMLGPLPLKVVRQPPELEVEETGVSYLENALLKASAAAELTGTWSLADDSGLEVDALNSAPGLYTARLAPTDSEKISKLLRSMAEQPYRSALFRSAMVLCSPDGTTIESSEGICWGELLKSPAYPGGGLESLFWLRETRCSYGELTTAQLSRLGSRGKAARDMAPRLRQQLGIR